MTGHPAAPVRRSGLEWAIRSLFGLLLAGAAIVTLFNPVWFACAAVVVALLAALEWHRLVRAPGAGSQHHAQTALTAVSITLAVALLLAGLLWASMAALVLGAGAGFARAVRRADHPLWHAAASVYLGLPVLALVALRALAPQGLQTVLGLFLIVWATDTGALVFGRAIGGAKLAPRLSPAKTWAGTLGGSASAAIVYGLYIGILGFDVRAAMAFAFVFSITAHAGDLVESAIKRHFGKKDSGTMIPGHGGVLDRMDSTILASIVLALLVFGAHFNPLFGGHS